MPRGSLLTRIARDFEEHPNDFIEAAEQVVLSRHGNAFCYVGIHDMPKRREMSLGEYYLCSSCLNVFELRYSKRGKLRAVKIGHMFSEDFKRLMYQREEVKAQQVL